MMRFIDMDETIVKAKVCSPLGASLTYDTDFKCNLIRCPVCGHNNSHTGDAKFLSSDERKAWDGRGSCITIEFEGECGHEWNLCIGYHKGENFVFNDITKPISNEEQKAIDNRTKKK